MTLESLKCNNYITFCFDEFFWLALIEVVKKMTKTSHASFSIHMDHQDNFTDLLVTIEGTYL